MRWESGVPRRPRRPRRPGSRIGQVVPDDAGKIAFKDSGVKCVRVLDSPCRPSQFFFNVLAVLDEAIGQTSMAIFPARHESISIISIISRRTYLGATPTKMLLRYRPKFGPTGLLSTLLLHCTCTYISQVLERRFNRALFLVVMTMPLRLTLQPDAWVGARYSSTPSHL